ncbi:MAG: outer membrane lipoprotein carrier protein LolA [Rhodospirillales bacterium]|nr:outer membrane lipoprotein carrier protein LolA [Rhodospirillales bacterium]MDE2320276.1 outer-membrane lipoprotein carrier protein LolA [Rhodospirillales bacterium]
MVLSSSDKAVVTQIETYLNTQNGLTANFLQVDANGATRTGKAWLERPGKMRFAYDPPDPQLLVAGFGLLVYHDPQLNQTTNIPLGATPLGILLAKHVDLESSAVYITNLVEQPGQIDLSLVRRGKEAAGTLTLSFSTEPLELRAWTVTDAQGRQTNVHLYDIAPGGPFSDSLFEYFQNNDSAASGG